MNNLVTLRESLLLEAVTGTREKNALTLLKQMEDLGVRVNAKDRDIISIELAKLIDLLPYSSVSMIYSGILAPILIALSKFDTYPVKLKDLTPVLNKSSDFKVKSTDFPADLYEKLVKYKFFKWESLQGTNDALMFYNNNVRDFIHYLLVIGLHKGVLGR